MTWEKDCYVLMNDRKTYSGGSATIPMNFPYSSNTEASEVSFRDA